ncbi:hypothetical protein [Polyangium aurulentum]|uniref:hypothetical protein n=1 Tax=Polyangium aurulentum TaxID=2567896 RepID=UPI00200DE825|nr:hypothetical protein [Polyangium aurulentum]UQA63197.1 hypothetical protein E8A73_023125 [Polyangium aurulentum]
MPINAAESDNAAPANAQPSNAAPAPTAQPTNAAPAPTAQPTKDKSRHRAAATVSPADEARFKAYVASGDRALANDRLDDAVEAYFNALNIYPDARISGRLGLVLSMFKQEPDLDIAIAFKLYDAVSDAAGISTSERRQFFDAYERVRKRVCKLDITTNDVNSVVTVGKGKPGRSEGAFWTFVSPGKTEVVATLEGHSDIRKTIECVPGKPIYLPIEFPSPSSPQAPPPITIIKRETTERLVLVRERPEPVALRAQSSDPGRFRGGVGPVMVFGAAPTLALGASAFGTYRLDGFYAMAGVRGAWSVGPFEGRPISAFAGAANLGPCAEGKWWNACAFAGVNVLHYSIGPTSIYKTKSKTHLVPGVGIALGGHYRVNPSLALRLTGDVTMLYGELSIDALNRGGTSQIVWDGDRFVAAISLAMVFGSANR